MLCYRPASAKPNLRAARSGEDKMQIDLAGRSVVLAGAQNAVESAVKAALLANGATVSSTDTLGTEPPDILILSHELNLQDGDSAALSALARRVAADMQSKGSGRIVHVVSAIGLVPMRRHEAASAAMAATIAGLRALAMQVAPAVLVNAVAAGFIDETDGAADPAMLSHVPLARGGASQEVANAVLFLCDPMNSYTTGQVLAVDGGWTAGYGRDF
jgi:NAD(P)-dependent dehydrogenase (short-subunit alcohol dehydrogenase family)